MIAWNTRSLRDTFVSDGTLLRPSRVFRLEPQNLTKWAMHRMLRASNWKGFSVMRYELSDNEWRAIRAMLPNKPRGVARVDDRRVLNGIFWILRSGAPWRDLPNV